MNLRPESEAETEFVPFDRPRVLRVLARIAAISMSLRAPRLPLRRKRSWTRKLPMSGIVAAWRNPSRLRDG